jgi:hypothetical protein
MSENTKQPHILISNDDGYLAPGLLALVNAIRPLGRSHDHSQFIEWLVVNVTDSCLLMAPQLIAFILL